MSRELPRVGWVTSSHKLFRVVDRGKHIERRWIVERHRHTTADRLGHAIAKIAGDEDFSQDRIRDVLQDPMLQLTDRRSSGLARCRVGVL